MNSALRLAKAIKATATPTAGITQGLAPTQRLQGHVLAVDIGPYPALTLTLAGSTVPIAGVKYNASYRPQVGDTVEVMQTGTDLWVVGVNAMAETGAVTPSVPTGLVANNNIDNSNPQAPTAFVTLNWNANQITEAVIGYDVQWRLTGGTVYTQKSGGADTTQVIRGLYTGTSYSFSVRARNQAGVSDWSTEVTTLSGGVTYNTTPGTPTGTGVTGGLDLIAQTNNAYVIFSWSAASTADAVVVWNVRYRKTSTTDYYTFNTSLTSNKITGLTPGVQYGFQVRSQNSTQVQSAWSTELTITVSPNTTPPATVTGASAIRTPLGALVSWNANPEGDIQGYYVQYRVNGGVWIDAATNVAGTMLYFIAPSTTKTTDTLQFQIKAFNWNNTYSTSWCTATFNVNPDGVVFDNILTGNLTAYGTLTSGYLQTSALNPRAILDSAGLRLYDNSGQDHGGGTDVTLNAKSSDGSLFISGTLSAGMVQGTRGASGASGGSGARMWLDFKDTTAGVGPLMEITAGTYDNIQVGNLAVDPSGVSAAQYGIRVLENTNGTVVFDTAGVMQNCKQIAASGTAGTISYQYTATYWQDVHWQSFTLTRQQQIRGVVTTNFYDDASVSTAANYIKVRIVIEASLNGTVLLSNGHILWHAHAAPVTPATLDVIGTLGAGTYYCSLQFADGGGGSFTSYGDSAAGIEVYLLGG